MSPLAILETAYGAASGAALGGLFKGAMVLATVLLFDLALRRQSAALRHVVWTAAFAALLALPVAGYLMPAWHLPLLPGSPPASLEAARPIIPRPSTPTPRDRAEPEAASESQPEASIREGGAVGPVSSASTGGVRWGALAAALWIAGSGLLLVRLLAATARASWICRAAEEVGEQGWTKLMERARQSLGVVAPVRLARSEHVNMPMVWGFRKHTVLLPESSAGWSEERREVVLMHEMAHVARGDCVSQLVSAAAATLHWFNPLVWLAQRRQAGARETACDDAVLRAGAAGADYAWHLLEIARAAARTPRLASAGVVMMARKSQLEGRLLAALDSARDRRRVSRLATTGIIVAVASLALSLAGLQPWAAPEAQAAEVLGAGAGPVPATAVQSEAARERVLQTMIELLDDPDEDMREKAAYSLGSMEDARAVEALARAVASDSDAGVRQQAAWALGMIEDSAGVNGLASGIVDPAAGVREQSAWALGMIESSEAVPALTGALGDESASVREQAAWALGMIEDLGAVDSLLSLLRSDADPDVRERAAWALGMIEDDRAIEALIDAVEDGNESVRKQALWAISQIMG